MSEGKRQRPDERNAATATAETAPRGDRYRFVRQFLLAAVASILFGFLLGRYLPGRSAEKRIANGDEAASALQADAALSIELLPLPDAPRPATAQVVIDEATRAVEHLVRSFPDTPDSLEIHARLHNWLGRSDEAVETWKECLKLDRNYAYALVGLATVASKRGEHEQMAELARKATEIAPGNFQARALRADALIRLGRAAEAIPVLEEFLKTDPRSQGHLLLGHAHFQMQRYDKARENYEAAIRKYPEYAEAYHGLSLTLARLGQPDKAKQAMDKFRQFNAPQKAAERIRGVAISDLDFTCSEAATLYSDAGRIYFLRDKPSEAERLWRRAAALDPKNVSCRQSMAWLCRQLGRTREAAAWLEQVAGIETQPSRCWIEIGRLREELVDFRAAEGAYRTAIQIAPQDAGGHAALASLFLRTGRSLPEALKLAQTAVERGPVAENYAVLAAACRRNGDQPGALAAAEKAVKLAPDDAAIRELYESLRSKSAISSPKSETD